jgi:acyl-CoA reductase-like NAD-dependent aldehyde dehydrogenase
MSQINGSANGDHDHQSSNGDSHSAHPSAVPLIIGGKDILGANTFTVRNPAGYEAWKAGGASAEDAINAVEAAQAALPAWSKTKPATRRDIFLKAAEIFEKRLPELAQIQKQETGAEDLFTEWILKLTVDNLKEVAGRCSSVLGSIPASTEEGRGAFVLKEPYGVILGIAPW